MAIYSVDNRKKTPPKKQPTEAELIQEREKTEEWMKQRDKPMSDLSANQRLVGVDYPAINIEDAETHIFAVLKQFGHDQQNDIILDVLKTMHKDRMEALKLSQQHAEDEMARLKSEAAFREHNLNKFQQILSGKV